MADRPILAPIARALMTTLGTVAFALAMGAVWLAALLHLPGAYYWFALPGGLALGYGIRAWFTNSRITAMIAAAGALMLADVYMQCLLVGLKLAAVLGLDKLEAMRRAGIGMLLALARSAIHWTTLLPLALGIALAVWMAWRQHARERARLRRHQAP